MYFNPVQTNEMPTSEKIKNYIWVFINNTIFRFTPPISLFKIWRNLLLKAFGAKIEWNCNVHPKAKIEYPWRLTMGSLSSIGERCWVYALDNITIGEKTCIGKEVNLITGSHDIADSTFKLITKPINIGNCVWVTTRATILPGVQINDFAVVANNSVVTKDVQQNEIVGGNPAKFIKKRMITE